MLENLSKGFTVMSKKVVDLDDKLKKAELVRVTKRIEELKAELENLQKKQNEMMIQSNVTTITVCNGEVELV